MRHDRPVGGPVLRFRASGSCDRAIGRGTLAGGYVAPETLPVSEVFTEVDDFADFEKPIKVPQNALAHLICWRAGYAVCDELGALYDRWNRDDVTIARIIATMRKCPDYTPLKGYGRETKRFTAQVHQEARRHVLWNWGWISRTADALMREGRLTGEQIQALQKER